MVYTTWDYYQEEYLGQAITDEDTFDRCAQRASATLDNLTRGRIPAYLTEGNELAIQNATCAVMEVLATFDKISRAGGSPLVVSESNDGFSQTYAAPTDPATVAGIHAQQASVWQAANLYLQYTGLLYAGGIHVS